MTKEEYEKNKDRMSPFKCDNGHTYMAFSHSCFFCKHCDLFWDYTNGPYAFACDVDGEPGKDGLAGDCERYEPIEQEEARYEDKEERHAERLHQKRKQIQRHHCEEDGNDHQRE